MDRTFFDIARVLVKGGMRPGGFLAFRRQKAMPRGGPAGGNSGNGRSIVFRADAGANTLAKFGGGAALRGRRQIRHDGSAMCSI